MSLDLIAPSADIPRAMSTCLKLTPSASAFHDSVIHIPRLRPTFPILSWTFLDFTIFSFCLFDLSIRPISSISFSSITGRPRIHSSMSLDISRPPSSFRSQQFSNGLYFNRFSATDLAGELLNVFFDRINVLLLQLTFLNLLFLTWINQVSVLHVATDFLNVSFLNVMDVPHLFSRLSALRADRRIGGYLYKQ
jgi:hypothetical protein